MVEQQDKPDMGGVHDKAKAELLGSDNDNDSDQNSSEKIIVQKQDEKGSDKDEEVFQDCLDEV